MASTSGRHEQEGLSSGRPPYFNGEHYDHWKMRMRLHVMSIDIDLWYVIEDGPHVPTMNIEKDGKRETVVASREHWSESDKKKMTQNAKAMNVLYNALCPSEANHISTCSSAKEMWDKLEIKHEGTNQVKESKINMLMHSYELFRMLPNESIADMDMRLTNILNSLESLGKIFTNQEKVQKILRSLPIEYDAKVTAIEEAKDLRTLKVEEMIGSLMVYERSLKAREIEKGETKRKSVAFVSKEEESENEDSEDDMAMLVKNFKKFMRYKKRGLSKGANKYKDKKEDNRTHFRSNREHKKQEDEPTCYKCGKKGHMKNECPMNKKEFKRKAFKATWDDTSDSEDSSDEEKEMASLCLMANNEEVMELNSLNDDSDVNYDDLFDMFNVLHVKYKEVNKEKKKLKKGECIFN